MELAPIAEPQLVVCKDNASARAMELAPIAEPQLVICKDNASARAMELAPIAEPQLVLCKVTQNVMKKHDCSNILHAGAAKRAARSWLHNLHDTDMAQAHQSSMSLR